MIANYKPLEAVLCEQVQVVHRVIEPFRQRSQNNQVCRLFTIQQDFFEVRRVLVPHLKYEDIPFSVMRKHFLIDRVKITNDLSWNNTKFRIKELIGPSISADYFKIFRLEIREDFCVKRGVEHHNYLIALHYLLMDLPQRFLRALNYINSQEQHLDDHLECIKLALQSLSLPEPHLKKVLDVMTLLLHKLASKSYSEFYVEQTIQILNLVPLKLFEDCFQNAVLILSDLLALTTQAAQALIPQICMMINKVIQLPEIMRCALPSLTSSTINLLLTQQKSSIQQECLSTLNALLKCAAKSQQYQNTKRFDIKTLKPQTGNLSNEKLNEYLLHFCKLINIPITPKLRQLYEHFISDLFQTPNLAQLLELQTQTNLIYLFLRFSDNFTLLSTSLQLQTNCDLQNELIQQTYKNLELLKKMPNQIDSILVIQQLRKLRWVLSLPYSIQSQIIYKSFKLSIFFKHDQKVSQVHKQLKTLEIDTLQICQGNEQIFRELKSLLQSIKDPLVAQKFFSKVISLLETLNEQVIVMENRVVQLKIRDVLKLASIGFICAHLTPTNVSSHQFLKLISLSYNLIIEFEENYVILMQKSLIDVVSLYFKSFSQDLFVKTTYIDYLLCQSGSKVRLVADYSLILLKQTCNDEGGGFENLRTYSASLIYRNISKLDDNSLQIDKGHAMRSILTIFELNIFSESYIYPVLQISFRIFDKYFLQSDPLFTTLYLKFINNVLKKWFPAELSKEVVTLLRQITLQVGQFFNSKAHQLLAFQCFYHMIPKLSKQELQDCQPQHIYGMNDDANVSIPNTLAVVFYEQRRAFEIALKSDSIVVLNYVWKIVRAMYQAHQEAAFFQFRSVKAFFEIAKQNEQFQNTKVLKNLKQFCQEYIKGLKQNTEIEYLQYIIDIKE